VAAHARRSLAGALDGLGVMKKATPVFLLTLAALAGAASVEIVRALPAAMGRFSHEREDVYILVALLILSVALGLFWAFSGARMLWLPAAQVPRASRFVAWAVLALGCLLVLSVAFQPDDLVLSCILAGACVLSAAVILSRGGGSVSL